MSKITFLTAKANNALSVINQNFAALAAELQNSWTLPALCCLLPRTPTTSKYRSLTDMTDINQLTQNGY